MPDKRGPINLTAFSFFMSVHSTIQLLKTGTQTMDFCKRSDPSLNPIQVVHMKHRRNIAKGGRLSEIF